MPSVLSNTVAPTVSVSMSSTAAKAATTKKYFKHTYEIYLTSGSYTPTSTIVVQLMNVVFEVYLQTETKLFESPTQLTSTASTSLWTLLTDRGFANTGNKFVPCKGLIMYGYNMCPIIYAKMESSTFKGNYLFYLYYLTGASATSYSSYNYSIASNSNSLYTVKESVSRVPLGI